MNIQLLVKMADEYTAEELDDLKEEATNRRINEDNFDEAEFWKDNVKWCHMPVVFPISKILPFSKFDASHSVIRYGSEDPLVVKIKFDHLKAIYSNITGEMIRGEADFKFQKSTKR